VPTEVLLLLRQALSHFGRPRLDNRGVTVEHFDERITTLEQRQQEIAARLRILEIAGDPRGIRDEP